MKRLICTLCSAAICIFAVAQTDSSRYAALNRILEEYYLVIFDEDLDRKCQEMDFLISQCKDSLTRQYVAGQIYSHYVNAPVMGEEAVAIHVYDKWYANGSVKMKNEIEDINASIFVDFNRSTLIGMEAPKVTLLRPSGAKVDLPQAGVTNILYFYDTGCQTCKAELPFLIQVLNSVDFKLNFFAVYTGTDKKAWQDWMKNRFSLSNKLVKVTHLWDPEIESVSQKLYGVLTTPRLYLIEPQGTVFGRRLEPDSLMKLLKYAGAIQEQYDKYLK